MRQLTRCQIGGERAWLLIPRILFFACKLQASVLWCQAVRWRGWVEEGGGGSAGCWSDRDSSVSHSGQLTPSKTQSA